MRLMVIGKDAALHARLRSSVEVRWLQSEVVEYNPVLRGAPPPELLRAGI